MTTEYDETKDNAEMMKIAIHVTSAVNLGMMDKYYSREKFKVFTGWTPDRGILNNYKEISYQKFNEFKEKPMPININVLREKLSEWYLVDKQPPYANKVLAFCSILEKKINDSFFHIAAHHGFVWRQIPGTKKAIFAESSENLAQRIGYLLKITRHREAGKHIIYLDFDPDDNNYYIAVSSKQGLIHDKDSSTTTQPNAKTATKYYKDWIKDVIEKIKEPSVFVYPELKKLNKINAFSSRKVLMSILGDRGISFNPKAHRLELYELYKRFQQNEEDEMALTIQMYGHECVVLPALLKNAPLNTFSPFPVVLVNGKRKHGASLIKFANWKDNEMTMILREKQILETDLMMEATIDNIMKNGKIEGMELNNLSDYKDVKKYDLEFGPANAFFD